jgi:hypothetical protein
MVNAEGFQGPEQPLLDDFDLASMLDAPPYLPTLDETPPMPELDALIAELEARRLARMPRRNRCRARSRRTGKPCRRWAMPNGRCYLHGGASTGPKTEKGRRRAIEAMQTGWRRWNEARKKARRAVEKRAKGAFQVGYNVGYSRKPHLENAVISVS